MSIIGYPQLQARLHAIGSPALGRTVMEQLALNVVREAKLLVPRKTGHLGMSIGIMSVSDNSARVRANTNYARYVEYGTGLYGPLHHKIKPTHAKALRWMGGESSSLRLTGSRRKGEAGAGAGWAFARSTKGMHPEPYMVPGALLAIRKGGLADRVVVAWNGAA